VVLIITDDQRADGLAGMPAVNSLLVRKGVRFSNGMVPTSLCCPSRSTILTGLYAHHTRVFGNGGVGGTRFGGWTAFHRRGLEYRTIATALTERGYRTGLFGKYLNDFGKMTPNGYSPPGWDTFTVFTTRRSGAYYNYRLTDGTYHGSSPSDYSTDVFARKARQFIRQTRDGRPLLLMFTPYAPHSPYTPAPRDASPPPGSLIPLSVATPQPDHPLEDLPRWQRKRQGDATEVEAVQRLQAASLLAVDDAVASFIRTMRREGRVRDTLFIFMSDNGYLDGEHGMVGKDNPYDASTRIPMVIRWDGHVPSGTVDDRLALNVDVAATIAQATGASMKTDGLDLLGNRTRVGFPLEAMAGFNQRPAYCGWRTATHMYVRYADGVTELYDYRTDPLEHHNLAGDPAAANVESQMRANAMQQCSPVPPGYSW
jgi:arylsulfatase A-like enzyme